MKTEPRITVTLDLSLSEAIRVIGVLRQSPEAVRIGQAIAKEEGSSIEKARKMDRNATMRAASQALQGVGHKRPAPPKVVGRACATCKEVKPWVREGGSCKECRESHSKIVL